MQNILGMQEALRSVAFLNSKSSSILPVIDKAFCSLQSVQNWQNLVFAIIKLGGQNALPLRLEDLATGIPLVKSHLPS